MNLEPIWIFNWPWRTRKKASSSPPPILTDAEREALEFFGAMEWPAQSQQIKARSGTIRALLKRLGDKT